MKRIAFALAGLAMLSMVSPALTRAGGPSLHYTFHTVVFPGDTFTQLLGINLNRDIAGYHGATINQGFTFAVPGGFTLENFPGSVQTQVIGIDNAGDTDGFFIDVNGVTHGFTKIAGNYNTADFPGTNFNQLLGLNNKSQAAGYFADASNIDHPYVLALNGSVYSEIFIPNAAGGAQATGINDAGEVVGFYIDGAGTNHGFTLVSGTFTTIDFPGATFTQVLGVNNYGVLTGVYLDAVNASHGFVTAGGVFQSIDDPNGVGTTVANGINARGDLVGFYVDSNGNTDGMVALRSRP